MSLLSPRSFEQHEDQYARLNNSQHRHEYNHIYAEELRKMQEHSNEPSRSVVKVDKFRNFSNVDKLIELWDLKQEDYVAIKEVGKAGNDGEVFQLFSEDGRTKRAVKMYRSGLNNAVVQFQQAIKEADTSNWTPAQRKSLEIVKRAAVPTGWVVHLDKKCLLFDWIPNKPRPISAQDLSAVRAQLDVVHKLGFVHLDVTERNVLRCKDLNLGAVLLDYDCVCPVGSIALGPIPPESSDNVRDRDPVDVDDDEHLWAQLQATVASAAPAAGVPSAVPPPPPAPAAPAPAPVRAVASSTAELIAQGKKFEDGKEYDKAFNLFKAAADQGDADAYVRVGWCYNFGHGVAHDFAQAAAWFKKAVDKNNNPEALYFLAYLYYGGNGVPIDVDEYRRLVRKSADQGFPLALYECLDEGIGCEANPALALQILTPLAIQGHPSAQCIYGYHLEHGRGLQMDKAKAFTYYRLSAQQGHVSSLRNLGKCHEEGYGTPKDAVKAFDCYKTAAERGHTTGMYCVGVCYEVGIGTGKDRDRAIDWYRKASAVGYAGAKDRLRALKVI